jgi:hypothetical protein
VDGKQIRTNAFVQEVLSNISWSIIDTLSDIPENPKAMEISLEMGSDIAITVDNQDIRMKSFVHRITQNIIMGMVDALDEIPENPQKIILSISKK